MSELKNQPKICLLSIFRHTLPENFCFSFPALKPCSRCFKKNVNRQKAGKLMWANIYIKKPKLYDYCYYTWTQWDNFISQIVHLNCYEKMSWDAETFFSGALYFFIHNQEKYAKCEI